MKKVSPAWNLNIAFHYTNGFGYYQEYKNMGKADKFFTRPQWFDMLVGNRKVRRQITEGKSEEEIRAGWQKELEEYKKMRKKYLIYE